MVFMTGGVVIGCCAELVRCIRGKENRFATDKQSVDDMSKQLYDQPTTDKLDDEE